MKCKLPAQLASDILHASNPVAASSFSDKRRQVMKTTFGARAMAYLRECLQAVRRSQGDEFWRVLEAQTHRHDERKASPPSRAFCSDERLIGHQGDANEDIRRGQESH
jgi:hypothetical protein